MALAPIQTDTSADGSAVEVVWAQDPGLRIVAIEIDTGTADLTLAIGPYRTTYKANTAGAIPLSDALCRGPYRWTIANADGSGSMIVWYEDGR